MRVTSSKYFLNRQESEISLESGNSSIGIECACDPTKDTWTARCSLRGACKLLSWLVLVIFSICCIILILPSILQVIQSDGEMLCTPSSDVPVNFMLPKINKTLKRNKNFKLIARQQCGKARGNSNNISDFPWIGAVFHDEMLQCSATLIFRNMAVTAKHCVNDNM